jgi:AAA15 family ATPase/GTPase
LDFKVKNYKSFVDEASFSMMAAPRQTGLDYSLLKSKVGRNMVKGLSTSVLYGPNASGKTNIIGAMDTFRSIVLQGNIRNSEEKIQSPNRAATTLELIPNNALKEKKPVEFYIDFIENENRIQYSVQMDIGLFLESNYPRKILKEQLLVNGIDVFSRDEKLNIFYSEKLKYFYQNGISDNWDGICDIAQNSLNQQELFMMNGFKLIISRSIAELVQDWFASKFMVIYRADSMQLIKRFSDPQKKGIYVEKTTDEAAKIFGINSNALGYVVSDDDKEAKLCSIIQNAGNDKNIAMSAEIFESYGTIRFINMFPLVLKAIQTGGTLVVDEFDASIHPMALMSIINIFHNDEINIHQAQLIFNTHNPIFLNSNIFRRDEIKFVERNDNTHESVIYSLSDFGTSGEKGVRKHEDYMKNYFVSQYGAINDIDFSPLFEELVNANEGGVH